MIFILFKVTTTTKTIREIQYLGPDGQPLDYVPNAANAPTGNGPPQVHPRLHGGQNYEQMGDPNYGGNGVSHQGHYQYPPQTSAEGGGVQYDQEGGGYPPGANAYAEYPHRPPTPPSPSDRSNSPPPQHREPGKQITTFCPIILCLYGRRMSANLESHL